MPAGKGYYKGMGLKGEQKTTKRKRPRRPKTGGVRNPKRKMYKGATKNPKRKYGMKGATKNPRRKVRGRMSY